MYDKQPNYAILRELKNGLLCVTQNLSMQLWRMLMPTTNLL